MSETRQSLEASLLRNPFDRALRLQYADVLRVEQQMHEALQQYDLITSQPDPPAAAHVGAALALMALERTSDAVSRYTAARGCAGFVPHLELERITASERRTEPVKIRVLPGGEGARSTADNVIPIERGQRDRIRFADIAGMDDLKRTIRLQIVEPFLRPGLFARFKKRAGGGILLYGPPGCGKTMMARAVATECRAEFMSVGISDILNMYIGESERNLALIFDKARAAKPCVLFFDELDALAYSRSKASSEHTRQVVNEFLSQLDGFAADNQEVLVLAATNMPWDVDSAMKRPGRFARQVFVPPPDEPARARLVELKLTGVPHDAVNPQAIAARTQHYSGADIEGLIELAKEYVLEDHITNDSERPVQQQDLLRAADSMKPSTMDWLRTARNLVKYAGVDDSYRDVEEYLKRHRLV